MSFKAFIKSAARNLHTLIVKALNQGGGVDMIEVEPYSYDVKNGEEFLFCYDLDTGCPQIIMMSEIESLEETGNSFTPRWPIQL